MAVLTYKDMGLNDEEYAKLLEVLGREPNYLELGMFSVMWSEHCGYKSSKPLLKTLPTEGPQVIIGPGENAGVVDIGDGQAIVFKIESHNSPSAVEPYQGAATGVGGIIRDIFTMGARPIAVLDSLRFGNLDDEKVQRLFKGAVAGIAGYGNGLGVPTVGGEVYFNPAYNENPLVNAMGVGLVNIDEIALAVAGEVGSPLILAGAKTGRDGIHGATFSSEELSDSTKDKRPTVQAGDPFMEKLLIEACLELIAEDLVAGMQDLGAAGLTSSVAEAASKKERGVKIDVSQVPCRESGMTPYEIMLAESQERMLIVPKSGQDKRVIEICNKWGLEAVVIGEVTDDGLFKIYEGSKLVGELPVLALTDDCPVYVREGKEPSYYKEHRNFDETTVAEKDLNKSLVELLKSPSIASKKWVFSQYDHQVMTNTVIVPGEAGAAVLRIKDTPKGIAVTTDCNSRMVYLDPYQGAMMAVSEAARNLACVGAKPLALSNCLNFGNPEKPDIYWQMQLAVKGIADASIALDAPVVSGNVSLYNETESVGIYPTPIIGMLGILDDINHRQDMAFKTEDDLVVLLGDLNVSLGGSEYLYVCHGLETGIVPEINLKQERALIDVLLQGHKQKLFNSCHDISEGGLAVALVESAIKGNMGVKIDIATNNRRKDGLLFSEAPTRVIVSLNPSNLKKLEELAKSLRITTQVLGKVVDQDIVISLDGDEAINIGTDLAQEIWGEAIPCIMGK
ncbi:MAG TPA: phosphoribosylformylglycinamidine synthase subunit PurL [Syntrophomonadaceae bacterium]|nr:phosphoribosylformylglycinamidine synthase subunit PurL [Syntrophomonadaceae bacterium]